jgi:hypothetical protein
MLTTNCDAVLTQQSQQCALADAVALREPGGGRPARVLSHDALDHLATEPLFNPLGDEGRGLWAWLMLRQSLASKLAERRRALERFE